jgi:hypothetical protein
MKAVACTTLIVTSLLPGCGQVTRSEVKVPLVTITLPDDGILKVGRPAVIEIAQGASALSLSDIRWSTPDHQLLQVRPLQSCGLRCAEVLGLAPGTVTVRVEANLRIAPKDADFGLLGATHFVVER